MPMELPSDLKNHKVPRSTESQCKATATNAEQLVPQPKQPQVRHPCRAEGASYCCVCQLWEGNIRLPELPNLSENAKDKHATNGTEISSRSPNRHSVLQPRGIFNQRAPPTLMYGVRADSGSQALGHMPNLEGEHSKEEELASR